MTTQQTHKQNGDPAARVEHSGRRHHMLIAGTGRAGTSALVRYLTALGLETHLSKNGEAAAWFDSAQAGLEDLPVSTITPDLPFVIKSPWSYEFVDDILSDPNIELDVVIVPIRDLTEAAASRTIMQVQAIHQDSDWMAQLSTTWEHWASTPGGTIFSLNPIDQARLLAVGFHRLLERVVRADVPIVFLAFPRLTSDPDYLFDKLSTVLPIKVSIEGAREAHAATFSAAMVRVEDELSGETEASSLSGEFKGPSLRALDNAALRRGLVQLRKQFAKAEGSRKTLETEGAKLREQLEHQQSQAAEAEAIRAVLEGDCAKLHEQLEHQRFQAAEAEATHAVLEGDRDMLREQLEHQRSQAAEAEAIRAVLEGDRDMLREQLEHQRSQAAEAEAIRAVLEGDRDMLREQLEHQRSQAAEAEAILAVLEGDRDMLREQLEHRGQLQREVLALRSSRSWRVTRPLRALSEAMRSASRSH